MGNCPACGGLVRIPANQVHGICRDCGLVPAVSYGKPDLRDQFAMAALAKLIGERCHPDILYAHVAEEAYKYADAMLVKREKAKEPNPPESVAI